MNDKLFGNNNYLKFCQSINNNQLFINEFKLLYKVGVLCDLYFISSLKDIEEEIVKSLNEEIKKVDSGIIKKLLETAFIFANLDSEKYSFGMSSDEKEELIKNVDDLRNKSYRIAISVYYYGKYLKDSELSDEKFVFNNNIIIYRLFTRLGILGKSRDEKIENYDIFSMDLQGKVESTNKEINNQFSIKEMFGFDLLKENFGKDFSGFNKDLIYFSDFQLSVMESLLGYDINGGNKVGNSISISAPTSAGKTFILKKYITYKIIESYISKKSINIVFIVPSKALINELKSDFIEIFEDYKIKNGEDNKCNIHTHLSGEDFIENFINGSNLFIFTQERLNYFYSDLKDKDNARNFKIDLIIVDEAHKVGYGYRGTLLSYIVGKVKKDNYKIQIILLAPLLSKLNKFRNEFGLLELSDDNQKFSNFGLVGKNEIIVGIGGKKGENYKMRFSLKYYNEILPLFDYNYKLEDYLIGGKFTPDKKMSVLPRFFSGKDIQSIIFRFGSDTVVKQIELIKNGLNLNNKENNSLSNYINDILPINFGLSEKLNVGLSYHNGKLPISIKTSIESYFKKNKIKYLSANYTVLEGVNLPAKNIFLSSTDYKNKFLSKLDIKNLIGRSGRLNEHLSGNVFYVNFTEKDKELLLKDKINEDLTNNISNILDDTVLDEKYNNTKFDRYLNYIKNDKGWDKVHIYSYKDQAKSISSELNDFEYMTGYLISKMIENKEGEYKKEFDFIKKISEFIYKKGEEKIEKLEKLKTSLEVIYTDIQSYGSKNEELYSIIKKNIFIDPRKQLKFYVNIIEGDNIFLNDNIDKYSEIISLLTDKNIVDVEIKTYGEKEYIREVTAKIKHIEALITNVQDFFIKKFQFETVNTTYKKHFYGNNIYNGNNTILSYFNQWISSVPLKKILGNNKDNYFEILQIINDEIQFNYLNAFSIYFEIANLGYKDYKGDSYDENKHKLDMNFLYYLELGTFYPNLIYLISKGVSRETALWLTGEKNKDGKTIREGIIKLFPKEINNEKGYFKEKETEIFNYLEKSKKYVMIDELRKFIY